MARTSQKINLKRWKRKFLGINEEGADITDDVYSKAQRLINIFRQLSVLNKDAIEKYNDMLLNVSSDVRSVLSTLPCGMDVRGYISYLQERRGLPIEEDDDEDDEEMMREREKAKIMAEAISQSTAKSAEAMQKSSMEQMERMTQALKEAQSRSASPEEIAKIAMSMQPQGSAFNTATMPNATPMAAAPMVPATIPMMQRVVKEGENGEGSIVYYQEPSDVSGSIGKAVADAIVQSQQQTSEIISKMLADALSRPQQVQNDSLKEISEMLANSQEKTANIILSSFGEAISRPQQVQNEGIRELAFNLTESNRKTTESITETLSESIKTLASRTDENIKALTSQTDNRIKELASSIRDSNRDMIEAINSSLRVALSQPEEYQNETLSRMAGLISSSQEQTARVILDAFATYINRPEERRSDELRLLTDVVARAVDILSQPQPTSEEMMSRFLEAQEHNSIMLARVLETLTGMKDETPATTDSTTSEENTELAEPLYGGFDESEFKPVQQPKFFEINDDGYPVTADEDNQSDYQQDNTGYDDYYAYNDGAVSEASDDKSPAEDSQQDDLDDYSSFFAGDSDFVNEQDADEDLMQIIPELPVINTKKKHKKQAADIVGGDSAVENVSTSGSEKESEDTDTIKENNAGVKKSSKKVKSEAKTVSENQGEEDFWVKSKSKKGRKKDGTKPFVMLPNSKKGGFTKVELG